MTKAKRDYAKIVKWSEEDACYVGMVPALFGGGCHGDDEQEVFAELCQIVDEWEEIFEAGERDYPPADPPNITDIAKWWEERNAKFHAKEPVTIDPTIDQRQRSEPHG